MSSGGRFEPLVKDPGGILDLPEGYSYRVFSSVGEPMDDGFVVPAAHDGMAAFAGPDGRTILVRNHEVNAGRPHEHGPYGADGRGLDNIDRSMVYDPGTTGLPALGGTTTIVYNTATQEMERHYLSLTGTIRNCAGGPTPWGSWITCEETTITAGDDFVNDHGYNFEVPATPDAGLVSPVPLKAMGRFNHEAVAVDPETGIVYQTEDRHEGLIYRFIPTVPGRLAEGGTLQALAVVDRPALDTRNWDSLEVAVGQKLLVEWMDVDNVEAPEDDLRFRGFGAGAARFARGEGMWHGNDAIYFACTNGGSNKSGQVWKYEPSTETLELFVEPNDIEIVAFCDNLTVAPWGDLILCEDRDDGARLIHVTPDGECSTFARNAYTTSELAGATFSPDGSTLFVNIQLDGRTLAITGPWA